VTQSRDVLDGRRWTIAGFVVCVLVDLAVAAAVLESPFGTLWLLDDSPPTGGVVAPLLAGSAAGVLQTWTFGARTSVVAAVATLVAGLVSIYYMFPAGMTALGCAAGAAVVLVLPRGRRIGPMAALGLVLLMWAAAVVYVAVRPGPRYLPVVDAAPVIVSGPVADDHPGNTPGWNRRGPRG
jgi:hypothetical protein